jgi:hypothetical protein
MAIKKQSEKSEKKDSLEKYGTSFSKNSSALEIVEKCDIQINKCKKWIENLETLKADKKEEAEKSKERFEDILKRMEDLSEKEKKLLRKKMGSQMKDSSK